MGLLERFVSLLGAVALVGIAFAFCPRDRRSAVSLRTVFGGLSMLVVIDLIVLKKPVNGLFSVANTGV
jgi:nucleoside permease NupC